MAWRCIEVVRGGEHRYKLAPDGAGWVIDEQTCELVETNFVCEACGSQLSDHDIWEQLNRIPNL